LAEDSLGVEMIKKWLEVYLRGDVQLFVGVFPFAPGVFIFFWSLEVDYFLEVYAYR
jgi:hypothetical protein